MTVELGAWCCLWGMTFAAVERLRNFWWHYLSLQLQLMLFCLHVALFSKATTLIAAKEKKNFTCSV